MAGWAGSISKTTIQQGGSIHSKDGLTIHSACPILSVVAGEAIAGIPPAQCRWLGFGSAAQSHALRVGEQSCCWK